MAIIVIQHKSKALEKWMRGCELETSSINSLKEVVLYIKIVTALLSFYSFLKFVFIIKCLIIQQYFLNDFVHIPTLEYTPNA